MIDTQELKSIISALYKLVPQRATMPILQTIRVISKENKLSLTANNIRESLTLYTDCRTAFNGFCVPAKQLNELLSVTHSEIIEIKELGNKIKIKAGKTKAQLETLNVHDFPTAEIKTENAIDIDTQTFSVGLRRSLISTSTEDKQPVLSGVLIKSDGVLLSIASADGFRLTCTELLFGLPKFEIIVPGNAIQNLLNVLKDYATAKLIVTDNQMAIYNEHFIFTSQLISGNFPDYKAIIPREWKTRLVIEKPTLSRAVKAATIFARDNDNIIVIDVQDSQIIVSGNSSLLGSGETIVENFEKDGPDVKFAINSLFFQQALSTLPDKFLMKLNTATHPVGLFIPDNETFTHIMMPMHIKQ